MIYYYKMFVMTTLIFASLSCNKPNESLQNKDQLVKYINISIVDRNVKFDAIFENVDILKLEVSDECLLGRMSKVQFYNDHIYIEDAQHDCVVIFDKSGHCIRKFNMLGSDLGQYQSMEDFNIDPLTGNFEILERAGVIHYYDNKGNYLRSKRIDLMNGLGTYGRFKRISSDKTIFCGSLYPSDKLYIYSDQLDTIIGSAIKSLDKRRIYGYGPDEIIYKARDSFFYFQNQTNTVYHILDGEFSKYAQLNFVNQGFDFLKYQDEALEGELIRYYSERKKLIHPIFGFSSDFKIMAAFNTNRWECYIRDVNTTDGGAYVALSSDLYISGFYPYYPFVESVDSNDRIRLYGSIVESSSHLEQLKNCMGVDSMEAEILDNFNPEVDNPILFSYNIKEKL